ncbi:MAG: magnesium/cobalt transporter CorA [Chloroflexi bacterium]|nr:magnesium/cobalt transporter CorA [Chloroflexota bacterium]
MSLETISYGKVTWVNIEQPTPEDVQVLRRNYDFHPLELEDCLSNIERPKIDEHENYLFIVMHFPVYDSKSQVSHPSEVDFFVGQGFLVSVHDGDLKPIYQLFDDCQKFEKTRSRIMGRGASRLLYSVIDRLVDYCEPVLRKVDSNIRQIEGNIFSEDMRRVVGDISIVRRDIIALRRIIRPQIPIVRNLEVEDRPFIREDLDVYFSDIVDHLTRLWDMLEDHREVVEGLSETSDSVISYRLNDTMRILTIISVIMLPLSLISGIYGMNVDLPLDHLSWAFGIVLGIMLMVAVGMIALFRRWHVI